MGIAIPQLAPASPDRSSGAQVINGSMLFTGVNYLTRLQVVRQIEKLGLSPHGLRDGQL